LAIAQSRVASGEWASSALAARHSSDRAASSEVAMSARRNCVA